MFKLRITLPDTEVVLFTCKGKSYQDCKSQAALRGYHEHDKTIQFKYEQIK